MLEPQFPSVLGPAHILHCIARVTPKFSSASSRPTLLPPCVRPTPKGSHGVPSFCLPSLSSVPPAGQLELWRPELLKAAADSESGVGFIFDFVWKCGIRKVLYTGFSAQLFIPTMFLEMLAYAVG